MVSDWKFVNARVIDGVLFTAERRGRGHGSDYRVRNSSGGVAGIKDRDVLQRAWMDDKALTGLKWRQ